MAIYVLLQCCKCNSKKYLHLYSCSSNKYDIYSQLCEHFNIRYSYTCKFGFFTLGWKIILEIKVQCKKCNSKYYNFGSTTFNSDYYQYDNHHACCYNVFIVSVSGYNYASDGKGLILQEKQRELEEKFKKQQETKKKRELEEKVKKQQEEKRKLEEKRKQEEKKRRELEEKLKKQRNEKRKQDEKKRRQLEAKIKIQKEIERQQKEEKKLSQLYNVDTDYIDLELNRLIMSADYKINSELSFDIEENMNKNIDFKISKFEFH